jgi:hypothetical protein
VNPGAALLCDQIVPRQERLGSHWRTARSAEAVWPRESKKKPPRDDHGSIRREILHGKFAGSTMKTEGGFRMKQDTNFLFSSWYASVGIFDAYKRAWPLRWPRECSVRNWYSLDWRVYLQGIAGYANEP